MVAILRRRTVTDALRDRVEQVRAKQPPELLAEEPEAEVIDGAIVFIRPDGQRLVLVTRRRRDAHEAARAHTPSIVRQASDGTYVVLELLGARP